MSRNLKAALSAAVFSVPFFCANALAQNEKVIVTASPIGGAPDRFATIVGQVDRAAILRSGGANLADALTNLPGITGSGFAAGASRPVIRGFDANRVRLLEDGVGSFDVSDVGPDHGVPIDPLSAESIEVVRGAATLRYGSQAIGGVVNAINNRVPTKLPDDPFTGEASASYGTDADSKQASVLSDARAGQFAFHADAFTRHTDNYDTPLGPQGNSFFKGDGFSAGSSYFFGADDKSRTGLAVMHYDAQYGIPSDTTYIDMIQTKVLSRSSFDVQDGVVKTVNVDAGYADYRHNEVDPATSSIDSTFKDREWDSRVEAVLGPMGPFSAGAVGAQVQNKDFSAQGAGADYLLPTRTSSAAAFAFVEAPLGPRLHLQGGARIEDIDARGTPASGALTTRNFAPISGALGVLFDASDGIKLGLTVSSAARAPGQTELFARGPHDGPATFETGDASLKMERANSLEGTVRVDLDPVTFEGSVWSSWFNNYIYGQMTGRTCDDTGACVAGAGLDLRELNYRQLAAHFWGLEGKSSIDLWSPESGVLQANFLGDFVRASLNDGTNVPRIPGWRLGGGLTWGSNAFDASTMLIYTGAHTDVAVAETPTPGFLSVDAQVTWRPFEERPGIELALIGKNLGDTVQRNATSFNKDAVVMPGRDVRLVLRTKF